MKKLLVLFFSVSLISCLNKNEHIYPDISPIYTKHTRNGYDVYCFKHNKEIRGMDSIYYTLDSVKHNDPPPIFNKK